MQLLKREPGGELATPPATHYSRDVVEATLPLPPAPWLVAYLPAAERTAAARRPGGRGGGSIVRIPAAVAAAGTMEELRDHGMSPPRMRRFNGA